MNAYPERNIDSTPAASPTDSSPQRIVGASWIDAAGSDVLDPLQRNSNLLACPHHRLSQQIVRANARRRLSRATDVASRG
jgi:hypothetical protein